MEDDNVGDGEGVVPGLVDDNGFDCGGGGVILVMLNQGSCWSECGGKFK